MKYAMVTIGKALCCCALVFSLAGGAVSPAAAWTPGSLNAVFAPEEPRFLASTDRQILAMGGSGEEAALAPRGGAGESMPEQLFSGSYVGALFFGYPATGIGGADLVLLAVLAYLLLRSVGSRKASRQDRFTVHRREDLEGPGHEPDEDGESRGFRPSPPSRDKGDQGSGGNGGTDPRDNPWTRRLRGQAPHDGADGQDKDSGRHPFGDAPFNRRDVPRRAATVKDRAEAMWGHLSSRQSGQAESDPAVALAESARIPAGFDVNDFLNGARTLYVRLQTAWASRRLDDIAPFIEPGMLRVLREQAKASPEPVGVEVVLVNATLLNVGGGGGDQWAEVHFNVLMKTGGEEQPSEVNEKWRFTRSGASGGLWQLAGIEAAD